MANFDKFLNITKLCKTCLNQETNLKKIRDTQISVDNNSKTILEILSLFTTMKVRNKNILDVQN